MAVTKAEIIDALRMVMDQRFADVPPEEEINYVFSPRFCARKDALIAEQRRGCCHLLPRSARKALVVAAVLAAAALLIAALPVVRETIGGLVITVTDEFVDYEVDAELRKEFAHLYLLGPMPEGFVLTEQGYIDPYHFETTYRDEGGRSIILCQTRNSAPIRSTDNEHAESFVKAVGDCQVLFSTTEGFTIASWVYDGYFFVMKFRGNMELSFAENAIASLCPTSANL